MSDKASYTKIENELAHSFRQRVNSAEDIGDVQKAFDAFLQTLLSRVSGTEVILDQGDVRVDPDAPDGFVLGPGLTRKADYARFLEHSDLPDILRRQAVEAVNRIKHLLKHTERAEAKIFPRPDRKY